MRIDDSLRGFHKFKKRKQWVEAKAAASKSWKRACSRSRERRRVKGEPGRWLEEPGH